MMKKRALIIVLCVLLVAMLPPILVNLIMPLPIKTFESLTAPDWLGFWGSYLGGLLGSIAALFALFETRHQSDLQKKENDENRRLSVMPALSLSCHALESNEKVESFLILNPSQTYACLIETNQFEYNKKINEPVKRQSIEAILCFTNYGLGPAFNVKITFANDTIALNGLKSGQTNSYAIRIFPRKEDSSYSFTIAFTDILGNNYTQKQNMLLSNRELFFSTAEHPSKS